MSRLLQSENDVLQTQARTRTPRCGIAVLEDRLDVRCWSACARERVYACASHGGTSGRGLPLTATGVRSVLSAFFISCVSAICHVAATQNGPGDASSQSSSE